MILLTGASGFIGEHLLNGLIKKHGTDNVVALTSEPIPNCNYLLHNGYTFGSNFFKEKGYGNITDIVHAGAFIPKSNIDANNYTLSNSNIYNTEILLNAELPYLKKITYLSTVDVYASIPLISEESLVTPVSLYGLSKYYCEKMIESWASFNNKEIQILRIGHVYGEGEDAYKKIIPLTMSRLLNKENLELWGSGEEKRSFIYVKDVVDATINSLSLPNLGVINIVGGTNISMKELINKIIYTSESRGVEVFQKELNSNPRDLVFNNDKLRNNLLPKEIELEEGLKAEWLYMKQKYE